MNTLAELEAARGDALEQLTERSANKLVTRAAYAAQRRTINAAFDEARRRLLGAAQTSETLAGPTDAPEPDKAIPAPAPTTVVLDYNGIKHLRRVDANGQIVAEPFDRSDGRDRPTFTGSADQFMALKRAGIGDHPWPGYPPG